MKPNCIIIGYSGHAYVVCDILLLNQCNILGYCDVSQKNENPFNLKYLGTEKDFVFNGEMIFIAIGDNKIRRNIFECLEGKATYVNAFHPSSSIGYGVELGLMTMVGAKSVVNPLVKIGNGVIINTGAIVEHESIIGDFVHIAPGAVLAGNVNVGNNSFVGAGAVIKQGLNICNDVIIGAGSVVVKEITEPGTYVGIPAKKI